VHVGTAAAAAAAAATAAAATGADAAAHASAPGAAAGAAAALVTMCATGCAGGAATAVCEVRCHDRHSNRRSGSAPQLLHDATSHINARHQQAGNSPIHAYMHAQRAHGAKCVLQCVLHSVYCAPHVAAAQPIYAYWSQQHSVRCMSQQYRHTSRNKGCMQRCPNSQRMKETNASQQGCAHT
jgi:hypothetical protein